MSDHIRRITEGATVDGVQLTPNDPVDIDKLVDAGVLPEEFRGKGDSDPDTRNGVYTVT